MQELVTFQAKTKLATSDHLASWQEGAHTTIRLCPWRLHLWPWPAR